MKYDVVIPVMIAFAISAVLGPIVIPFLRRLKVGQTERKELESHLKKNGTPTMGGLMILASIIITSLFYMKDYPKIIPILFMTVGFGIIGFLDDFLKTCKRGNNTKNIMLLVDFKIKDEDNHKQIKIPMISGHYIIDNVWFSQVCKTIGGLKNITSITNDDFIYEMEQECLEYPNDWGDLYNAPMEALGNCELRFNYDITKGFDEDIFEIQKITEDEENIYIHLIEK